MNNILLPGADPKAIGGTEFSLRLVGNGIDLKFNGDPEMIINMLYESMVSYEHIAKTVITTVLIFADQKKIPLDQLKKHSYIQDGKIIKP